MGKVVLVEPDKNARIKTVDLSLENMQKLVGGLIQVIYPFEDDACLVCNDEGKINGLPLDRALTNENGDVYDIIAGTFFICRQDGENLVGLTNEQMKSYHKRFLDRETFVKRGNELMAVRIHEV